MDILVNVVNQRLKIESNLKTYVSGTQKFVRFLFDLSPDWENLKVFAQFRQGDKAYNQYLDENKSVYLPSEIGVGSCTMMLYGNNDTVIGTTNYLTFIINDNCFVEDANSTEISSSLYAQLVTEVYNNTKRIEKIETDGVTAELVMSTVEKEMAQYLADGKLALMTIEDGTISREKFDEDINDSLNSAMKIDIYDTEGKKTDIFKYIDGKNNVYSNVVFGTLTGKAARADDVSPLPHKFNISIKGESTQESEPTIDAPVEVVHCDSPTVKLFRKNLLKYPYWSTTGYPGGVKAVANADGSLTLNGTIDGSKLVQSFVFYNKADAGIPMIVLKKGVTYRALLLDENGNKIENQFSIRICDGKDYGTLFTNHSSSYTPTVDKPIYTIALYALESASGTTFTNKVVYPMLEIVGESDEYGEYSEQSVTIPLTLAGQGDYKDEIVVDQNTKTVKHIQRYYKYEFTGEEDWGISATNSYSVDTTLGYVRISGLPFTHSSVNIIQYQLCNALPCVSNYNSDIVGIHATVDSSRLRFNARIPTANATSSDFNEVFKSGTYLWYPMAEPIETDYTDTEWGQALLALVSDGETLTFDCDAETTINYSKDVNKVIQKLTDAIIALGGTI